METENRNYFDESTQEVQPEKGNSIEDAMDEMEDRECNTIKKERITVLFHEKGPVISSYFFKDKNGNKQQCKTALISATIKDSDNANSNHIMNTPYPLSLSKMALRCLFNYLTKNKLSTKSLKGRIFSVKRTSKDYYVWTEITVKESIQRVM